MKKLYCILLLSLLSSLTTKAQDLYLKFNTGASVNYGLSTVNRITFSATDMEVHITGSPMQSYGMDSIAYYKYQPSSTGIIKGSGTNAKPLKIYPNPTKGKVELDFSLEKSSEIKLVIYSLSGQELFVKKETASAGKQQLTIDMNAVGMPSGVYFLELSSAKERFINKLIIE